MLRGAGFGGWARLSYGLKVAFKVAFNFKGPTIKEMRVVEG